MESKNGASYGHNYDVIVKWMAAALRGETLEALGVKTGRIEEVFAFEPVEIAVKSGRVDIMARDETGALFHIEEQRNLSRADLYRSAAYHFLGAKQWGMRLTDIILASGNVIADRVIKTESGAYNPIVIDFSVRDGAKRLNEIRAAVQSGVFNQWAELIFLPLYGKESGMLRSEFAEQVVRFETELYHAEKISAKLLAATLIMSNKLIDKDRIRQIWEDIKMLDILEIAKEEGIKEGKSLGIQEGKSLGIQEGKNLGIQEGKNLGIQEGKSLGIQEGKNLGIQEGKNLGIQELIVDTIIEKFNVIPTHLSERIRNIKNPDTLKGLFRLIFKCGNVREFEEVLNQV